MRYARAVWSLLLCVASSGCVAYTGSARDVAPNVWKQERGWIAVDNVPLLRQQGELDCGPTALAMVLSYWRPGSPPADWLGAASGQGLSGQGVSGQADGAAAQAASPGSERVSTGELRDRARALGLTAEVVTGDLRDIRFELSNGRPVIVGVAKPTAEGAVAHYEVVVGLHPDSKRIATLDPAVGWRQNSYQGFLREWIPTGRVLLVVAPPSAGSGQAEPQS
jgi:hypothetical protein